MCINYCIIHIFFVTLHHETENNNRRKYTLYTRYF